MVAAKSNFKENIKGVGNARYNNLWNIAKYNKSAVKDFDLLPCHQLSPGTNYHQTELKYMYT